MPQHTSRLVLPDRLPETVRWAVIEKWLLGTSRNSIAIECRISAGAVSSIVDEWSHYVGINLANVLRGLAVTLRKQEISPAQCAYGLRMVNLIDKMGLDVNSIESFLSEVYIRIRELDINPKYIARYVEGLISFVNDLKPNGGELINAVSILEIDSILKEKRQYNIQLDDEYRRRKARLDDTNEQIYQGEKKLDNLNQKNELLEQEIGWRSQLRDELKKYGLDVSNIRRVVDGARFFSDNNHSVNEMLITYSNYQKLLSVVADQKSTLDNLTDTSVRIEAANKAQEDLLQERRLKSAALNSLKNMGLGLRELKILHSLIVELATENGQSAENGDAVRNFISDIENHYYDYIRLRKAVEDLKNREALFIALISKQSRLGRAVDAFLRKKGVTDEDVNSVIDIMELYTYEDTSSADSEARTKENETKDLAKGDAALPESRRAMTHQDVEKSGNPLADGNKHRKLGKPRYPHPLPSRKLPHRGRYETISAKRKEGQVRASLVTPVDNTDRILLKPIGQGTDSNVDVGRDISSSMHQSSHNIPSTKEEQVVRLPEGSDSSKQKKRGHAPDLNPTEMMNRAMENHR